MKKGILFGVVCIAVLFIATFAACNSNEEPIVGNQRDTIVMSNPEFSTLLSQIENLNKSYTSMSSRSGDDGSKNGNNMSARDSADIVQLADTWGIWSEVEPHLQPQELSLFPVHRLLGWHLVSFLVLQCQKQEHNYFHL